PFAPALSFSPHPTIIPISIEIYCEMWDLRFHFYRLRATTMFLSTLFSLPADVYLADVCLEQETLTLVLKASQTSAACPECTHPSTRIRGRYTRTLADLPCQELAVRVRLEVCRFVCRTRGCPRTTFAEGCSQLSRIYARRTLRQA